jgi:outer membrane protein assembly factor BamD
VKWRLARVFGIGLAAFILAGCGLVHRHGQAVPGLGNLGDQPDKVLYERAVNEIQHGRYDVGRITLQTLMNTYPDSEYLAKAKLAIADSYYKEGGISGLTQAETEYKDFITFFPTAPEAPEAQFRVGMAHFHLMGKPDRDRQEALVAEAEFKEFLLKYPDSPLMPRAKARLREVQEVLGQSDYKIAHFYYMKGAMPAARSRFQEIVDQYSSFSEADAALWYLAQSWERMKKPAKAAPYYAQLLTNYPLSEYSDQAKDRLSALHQPIPKASKAVMARARADQLRPPKPGMLARLGTGMSSAPDYRATRHGPVQLSAVRTESRAAKGPAPEPTGNTIAVQPVPDTALISGKSADPKEGENGAGNSGTTDKPSTASSQQNATAQSGTQQGANANPAASSNPKTSQDVPPPRKKKGKLHFLKKLVP